MFLRNFVNAELQFCWFISRTGNFNKVSDRPWARFKSPQLLTSALSIFMGKLKFTTPSVLYSWVVNQRKLTGSIHHPLSRNFYESRVIIKLEWIPKHQEGNVVVKGLWVEILVWNYAPDRLHLLGATQSTSTVIAGHSNYLSGIEAVRAFSCGYEKKRMNNWSWAHSLVRHWSKSKWCMVREFSRPWCLRPSYVHSY